MPNDHRSPIEAFGDLSKKHQAKILAGYSRAKLKLLTSAWLLTARPDQLPPDSDWLTWFLLGGRGGGKALALDTPLPTPKGWTTMGTVQVGDELFTEDGQPCHVTFVSKVQLNRPCYQVVFDDGHVIVADADHQWLTWDHRARKAHGRAQNPTIHPAIRTTVEIQSTLLHSGKEHNHSIRTTKALQLPDVGLPIDSRVLGFWLGDGTSRTAEVTVHDRDASESFGLLAEAGITISGPVRRNVGAACAIYPIGGRPYSRDKTTGRMTPNGSLHSKLKVLGVLGNKHVPVQYLRGSEDQRRALLAGLMDTDGSAAPDGRVEFCSTRQSLAEAVFELAVSLGHKPYIAESAATLYGREVGRRWRVQWRPRESVFRLNRKVVRTRVDLAQKNRTQHRYIVAVETIPSVPVRCLAVDAPSHLFLAGRGMIATHNTRTGSEWIQYRINVEGARRIALIARRPADVRDVMVQGPSGLEATAWPGNPVQYNPSIRRLTWANGAVGFTYSSWEPEDLRGPEFDTAWCDELGKWKYASLTWDNLELALRLGDDPRACVTTTPRAIKKLKELLKEPTTATTRCSTYDNRRNLSHAFFKKIVRRYEGTTMGRQEIMGHMLDDVEGALWKHSTIDDNKVNRVPSGLARVVIGVDPAVSAGEDSNETGIIVAGCDHQDPRHYYVMDDMSDQYSPQEWGDKVLVAYRGHMADYIVGEVNNGGDLVERNVQIVAQQQKTEIAFKQVRASRGKSKRAQPIAALYEQGRVHHVGTFPELEDQCCTFVDPTTLEPGVGRQQDSPDRMDAAVWALTELSEGENVDDLDAAAFEGLEQEGGWEL